MEVRKRTLPSGKVQFFMDYRQHGQRIRKPLKGAKTITEARGIADIVYGDIVRKEQLGESAGPTVSEKCLTIKHLLEWDRKRPNIADRTKRSETEHAKALTDFFGDNFRVASLNVAEVQGFIRRRMETNCKGRTVNFSLSLLRAAINRAVEAGILHKAPCKIRLVPEEPKKIRFLTLSELGKLLEECKRVPVGRPNDSSKQKYKAAPRLHALAALLSYAGLRPNEAYTLCWRDINLQQATLSVESEKTAGRGKRRDILPLNSVVVEALQEYRKSLSPADVQPEALAFGTEPCRRRAARFKGDNHKAGYVSGVKFLGDHRLNDWLKAAAKRAGLQEPERVSAYSLRHSFASALVKGGSTIPEVAALMRHSPIVCLRTYAHADAPGLRDAVSRLASNESATVESIAPVSEKTNAGHTMGTHPNSEAAQVLELHRIAS